MLCHRNFLNQLQFEELKECIKNSNQLGRNVQDETALYEKLFHFLDEFFLQLTNVRYEELKIGQKSDNYNRMLDRLSILEKIVNTFTVTTKGHEYVVSDENLTKAFYEAKHKVYGKDTSSPKITLNYPINTAIEIEKTISIDEIRKWLSFSLYGGIQARWNENFNIITNEITDERIKFNSNTSVYLANGSSDQIQMSLMNAIGLLNSIPNTKEDFFKKLSEFIFSLIEIRENLLKTKKQNDINQFVSTYVLSTLKQLAIAINDALNLWIKHSGFISSMELETASRRGKEKLQEEENASLAEMFGSLNERIERHFLVYIKDMYTNHYKNALSKERETGKTELSIGSLLKYCVESSSDEKSKNKSLQALYLELLAFLTPGKTSSMAFPQHNGSKNKVSFQLYHPLLLKEKYSTTFECHTSVTCSKVDLLRDEIIRKLGETISENNFTKGLQEYYDVRNRKRWDRLRDWWHNYAPGHSKSPNARRNAAHTLIEQLKYTNKDNFDIEQFLTLIRAFNELLGGGTNGQRRLVTSIKGKHSRLRQAAIQTMEKIKQEVNKYSTEELDCIFSVNKDHLYSQLNYYTNWQIQQKARNTYKEVRRKWAKRLWNWLARKNYNEVLQRDESLIYICSELMNCKTPEDYLNFLKKAHWYYLHSYPAKDSWAWPYRNIIKDMCHKVYQEHIVSKSPLALEFNVIQLKQLTDIASGLGFKKLAQTLDSKLVELSKEDALMPLELRQNQATLSEEGNIEKEQLYQQASKNLQAFKQRLLGKLQSHVVAEMALSTGRFRLNNQDLGYISMFAAAIVAHVPLPGSSGLAAVVQVGGEVLDEQRQTNTAGKLVDNISGQGGLNNYLNLMITVVEMLAEICGHFIGEMANRKHAEEFAEFCFKRMHAAWKNSFKTETFKGEQGKNLGLVEKFILSIIMENQKLTIVPARKDHYVKIRNENLTANKTTFQGIIRTLTVPSKEELMDVTRPLPKRDKYVKGDLCLPSKYKNLSLFFAGCTVAIDEENNKKNSPKIKFHHK